MSSLAFSAFVSPILPKESIASYLGYAFLFADDHAKKKYAVTKKCHPRARNSHLLPSRLGVLIDMFSAGMTDIDSLLYQNTMFPAMRLSLSVDDVGLLKSHFCDASVRGIATISGISYPSLRRGWDVAICRECFNEDLHEKGRQFLHREWAFATLAVCSKHKSTLWRLCNECPSGIRFTRNIGLLQDRCFCGSNLQERFRLVDPHDVETEVRIAQSLDMLTHMGVSPEIDSRHTHYVLRKRARELNLIGHMGVRVEKLNSFAVEALGDKSLSRHKLHWGRGGAVVRMLGRRGNYLRNSLHHAMLVAALFASPEAYESEVMAARILSDEELDFSPSRERVPPLSRPCRRVDASVELYLYKALSFLCANPSASRRDIKCELGEHGYRVLFKHRRAFVDTHFPSPIVHRPHNPEGILNRQRAYDAEFANEVRGRHAAFGDKLPPYRISRQRLIDGFRSASNFNAIKERLPDTVKALSDCVETTEKYALRVERRFRDLPSGREEKS